MTSALIYTYTGFYIYLIMLVTQWAVATFSKAKAPNAIPGKISDDLSHDSFIFRAHRTFHNTLENSALFVATVLFAMAINYQSMAFSLCVWVYVIARIIHMVLYYAIATEKNPSPRTYFFLISLLANLVMLVLIGIRLYMY
ncbi:MAPEG family protein [Pseudoalteromonas sp. MMG010]|uniref:MAPEG family protein n=1 Tax=Pseudoalteromonas sp. MMG010 TaxID=2822685 RepID=UPI001B39F1B4|nr:MAPEG family protein [Pseudoalteromonas sp. MMG010]MBQ4832488.1 MAPEG family protein [Pseudoalteromonas sp. MMG010]